jgi:hypothetical protein
MNQPKTTNQIKMPSSIIQFQIQTLEGKELFACIQKSEAEKVYTGACVCIRSTFPNPYDSYGLDFLKTAISEQNGIDTTTMQLFTAQGELTTATPLLLLQNQVLYLMVKSPITVTFQNPQTTVYRGQIYALERNIDFLKGTVVHSPPTVCYIHTPDYNTAETVAPTPPPAIKIQAVGCERDFFKISIKNLPFHLLRDLHSCSYAEQFVLRPLETPKHLWLRFDKSTMTLD